MLEQPGPDALLANLKEDEGDPKVTSAALDMRGVGNPLYNMMNIVIRANGAVDWGNGLPLTASSDGGFRIDRHHIFPADVLTRSGWDTGESQYARKRVHEIANRVPLAREGYTEMFDHPPSVYLPEVARRYPGTLAKSLIPANENLWQIENFEEFLAQRRRMIADAINDYMSGLVGPHWKSSVDIAGLIAGGESQRVEFKSRFHGGSGDYSLEAACAKAVAGMLNAEGGCLLLGVKDDGEVIGIEADYARQGKPNRDGFEIELTNLLAARLGPNALPLIRITFDEAERHDVCILQMDPCSKPVYVQENGESKFYVRLQNATRPLGIADAAEYIGSHFG